MESPTTSGEKVIKAIYAGTFDPITNGHMDIINRSMEFCTKLVVAIGMSAKKTMFTEEERVKQINKAVDKGVEFLRSTNIEVAVYQGLTVEYAKQIGAKILVRGIRSVSDFEYEINLANINKVLAPDIETVFLPTSPELAVVSSSMVKEIARMGGDVSRFAPAHVVSAVNAQLGFFKTGNPEK
jgi:pantetheine-phosphate adenylyltransferase